MGLALILNEVVHKRFLKVAQSTMLFPYFISWAVVAMMLYAFPIIQPDADRCWT